MLDFPRWKVWGVTLLCLLGIAFAVPSFFPASQVERWPGFIPSARINLGLDLAGGSHLLLEGDTSDIARQQLETMEELIRTELRRASPRIEIGEISTAGGRLSFLVRNPAQADAAREIAYNQTQPVGLGGQRNWNVNVVDTSRIVMVPSQAGLEDALDSAMNTAREVVYNRVDPSGTKEVTVIRQGERRILVQVPGLQDPEGLKQLLGKTARLDFKLVDLSAQPTAQRAPVGSQFLPYPEGPGGRIAVKRRAMVTGDQLVDASQAFDQTTNEPVVNIRFDSQGGRRFAKVTQENVNRPFAIILDDVVISAPNINEPILGGSAQIAGNFTVESANDLAVQLRSGKLPVEFAVIEERTVGPELGAESIRLGGIASIVAVTAVITFMLVTYGRFGIYATVALALNAIMILGIMAVFNAALTLPGIAGFVLTIGAAVDANVLINERIREEQRRGRKILDAIETGYREASTAIFDANITNVIAAALMYYFGSGPVRGFAVVLLIGIVTSVFTAVNVTRMLVALWVRKKRPRELHI
ncbi:MAG: Protein translocase subunit SecD [uncultured Sphingosinicella sp.]|uniref:Protein translocase subunit SecD n=1 Tax=uncultured Sphingosinicella sp. TaxID=478748 RepID=A0A6J4UDT6_9SPHN|nr:protein translocase subunit SecD [uncultured Sphingosinicella sp.]CAA9545681.1 MAG: Protein translocase subunit SecD [uncultured Sphingosinicella sp.]